MQSSFIAFHNGEELGPFSSNEIVAHVLKGDLAVHDYVYDEERQDWVLIWDVPDLVEAIKKTKPKGPPKKTPMAEHSAETASTTQESPKSEQSSQNTLTQEIEKKNSVEWFVLKGENKYGPFSYLDLVKMLQEKAAFEFDYVWNRNLGSWMRIAELEDFQPEEIKRLQTIGATHESSEVFFRRRHHRARFGGSIIVHDNTRVWKGKGINISAGGAGIEMENAMILPGQTLYLHFKPGDGVPPFNAICEVVSKKYIKGVTNRDTSITYGVKFTSISRDAQQMINDFASQEGVSTVA